MAKCYVCGAVLEEGSRFCVYCGADQTKKPEPVKPKVSDEPKGIDLNLPLDTYKKFMSMDDLFKVALAKLTGVALKKNVNEAIHVLVDLSKEGHVPSIMKLASLCLRDERTFTIGYIFLYQAAKLGDTEAVTLMKKLGFDTKEFDVKDIPPVKPDIDDDAIDIRPIRTNLVDEDILRKVILIKTISTSKKRAKLGIGFVTDGGYVLTSFQSINFGSYSSIKGTFLETDSNKAHPLKVEAIDDRNDVVLLKFKDAEFDDLDIEENIGISDSIPTKGHVITIGIANGSLFASKDEIVGYMKKNESKCNEKLLKIRNTTKNNITSAVILDERMQVIGLLDTGNGKGRCFYAKTGETIIKVFMEV